ncbi:MAG: hypothetical protein RLZZ436_510 [Planctomycetota bacterium]|jgi:hypothetical protein
MSGVGKKQSLGFLRAVRTCGSLLAAGLTLGSGLAAEDPGVLVTNTGRFEIPFEVDRRAGRYAEGLAVLYGSQDKGRTWERLQSVPVARGAFVFSAPRDGEYSFAIRMTDPKGALQQPIRGSAPEMTVLVDTVAPVLRLEAVETTPGHVSVAWTASDSGVDGTSFRLEYVEGLSGSRKPVPCESSASGQARISIPPGSAALLVASICDTAGNRAEARTQVMSRGGTPTGSAALPLPAARTPSLSQSPLGPSPFAIPGSPSTFGISPGPGEGSVYRPPVPIQPAGDSSAAAPLLAAQAGAAWAQTPQQLVNNRVFELDYQIDDVGPSGVSAVELFITEDGGGQWFRYGSDPDVRSPFQVDAMSEGTFGFAVRIRNGLGVADTPPQPGQPPEVIITVDQTPPTVQMQPPGVSQDGAGTIQFSWRVQESNPAEGVVRLESSPGANGPWTPVFDWQPDQGGFELPIRPGMPPSLYFRLLARDAAGNVGMSQTIQPVIVDLKRPVGRILRVQPSMSPGTR